MKKIYLLSLLTFFSLSLHSQTHWEKYSLNPVLKQGSFGEWDYIGVQPTSVLYLDSAYQLWYWGDSSGVKRMGYASSPDGLTWTKYVGNPVLDLGPAGSWDETGVACGYVVFQNEVFHMWYTGHEGLLEDKGFNIGHATSPDGINWTKDLNNPVLKVGPYGSWDGGWISLGSVIFDGNQYQMWYEGWKGSVIDLSNQVGFGHATSPDGTNWTKCPQNPILVPYKDDWDYPRMGAPSVVFDGSNYKMWYLDGTSNSMQMGYATSEDGVNWTKCKTSPVLKTGPEGAWDDCSLGGPAVLDSAGVKYKLWYGASDDPNRLGSIGFAESDTRVPILTIKSEPILETTMTLEVETSQGGSIYIIPMGTRLVADSIVKYKVAYADALANTLTRIPLIEVQTGEYLVTSICDFGRVCYQGVAITIVDDLSPPVLTLDKVSINFGDPIVASSSKEGILFLVDDMTPENIHYIRSSRLFIDSAVVKADVPVEFTSDNLNGKEYRLFALDKYGSLSVPKNILIWGVGINQSVSDNNWVNIYPNPTDKLLMIHLQKHGDHSVRICTLSGQEVIGFEWTDGSREIDLSSLDPGLFLITIVSEDHRWTGKLIKF